MATVNFYLKNEGEPETLVILYFRYHNQLLKYSTGIKVSLKHWDKENMRFRRSASSPTERNDYLQELKRDFEKVYLRLKTEKKEINNDTIREGVEKIYQNSKGNPKPKTFFNYLEEYITSRKGLRSERTIYKFTTLSNLLKDFEKKLPHKITFARIDNNFYEKFILYLQQDITEVKPIAHLNNTAGKYVSSLKTFLTWASDQGLTSSTNFQKFKVFHEEADIIYLTWEELLHLYNFDLSNSPNLHNTKEAFCFGCFTGLRYSDIARLSKENIKGDSLLLNTQKTRDRLTIPLNHYAKDILKRNGYKITVTTNQDTNRNLKEVCEKAGLKDPVMIVKYRGTEEVRIAEPKYNLITTHTARRTFVTLSLEKGMRAETLMQITGHKSFKTLKKYIKITDTVKTLEMGKAWKQEPIKTIKMRVVK